MSSSKSLAGFSTCGICLSGGLNAPYLTRRREKTNITLKGFPGCGAFFSHGFVRFGTVWFGSERIALNQAQYVRDYYITSAPDSIELLANCWKNTVD